MPFASRIVQFSKKGPALDFIPDQAGQELWYPSHYVNFQYWFYTTIQITGINTQIVMILQYDDISTSLLYRVDNNQYNGANPLLTHPTLNGFTYVAANDGFYVNPGQWVTFTVDYTMYNNYADPIDIIIQDPFDFSTEYTWSSAGVSVIYP